MIQISPFPLPPLIEAPVSKSHLQRELILSLLSDQPSRLKGNFKLLPDDGLYAIKTLETLGAKVQVSPTEITVIPPALGSLREEVYFSVGESGFLLRTMLCVGFLFARRLRIDAAGTLLSRDLRATFDSLRQLGIAQRNTKGTWPIVLERIEPWPHELRWDASETSQVVTGLLFTMARGSGPKELTLINPVSLPYITLSLQGIANRGVSFVQTQNTFSVGTSNPIQGKPVQVQGDWSGASNLLCMAAIRGQIRLAGLPLGSNQADEKILTILKDFGAEVETSTDTVWVKSKAQCPIAVDVTHCPDLFPALSVLASCANGISAISGTHRLYNKESNRLEATCMMLAQLGVRYEIQSDTLFVHGGFHYRNGMVISHHDHRIVLAAIVAAYALETEVAVDEMESIKKSFPEMKQFLSLKGIQPKII
ncbi:MAG: 3-phosphoshikimate 1-carboxyvinyltransferase [Flavobacteriales bacterium]